MHAAMLYFTHMFCCYGILCVLVAVLTMKQIAGVLLCFSGVQIATRAASAQVQGTGPPLTWTGSRYAATGLRELAATGVHATALCAGHAHTCIIDNTAGVRCWGAGANGRLGYNSEDSVGDDPSRSIAAAGQVNMGHGVTAQAVGCGAAHTCIIDGEGGVRCWGDGSRGAIGYDHAVSVGDGAGPDVAQAGQVALGLGVAVASIACGSHHTCVIDDSNNVRCWGAGDDGRLGYDTTASVGTSPSQSVASAGHVYLGPGITARAIACGEKFTCIIDNTDGVRCWGNGADGALGYHSATSVGTSSLTPVAAAGQVPLGDGISATAIATGDAHTCVIDHTGAVWCWGLAASAPGGTRHSNAAFVKKMDRSAILSPGPVALGPGVAAKAVAAGGSHTCIIDNGSGVRCWGGATAGVAPGSSMNYVDAGATHQTAAGGRVDLGPGVAAVAGIACGSEHICAIDGLSSVRCWGHGGSGQLGHSSASDIGGDSSSAVADSGAVPLGAGVTVQQQHAGPPPTAVPSIPASVQDAALLKATRASRLLPASSPSPSTAVSPSASPATTAWPTVAVNPRMSSSPIQQSSNAEESSSKKKSFASANRVWIGIGAMWTVIITGSTLAYLRRRRAAAHANRGNAATRHDSGEIQVHVSNPMRRL